MSGRTLTMVVIVGLAMALVVPAAAVAQETINATVIRVVDGDTIEVQPASGAPTTVGLLGIDAPESVAPGTPIECGSEDAAAYLTDLVQNAAVVLTPTHRRTASTASRACWPTSTPGPPTSAWR
jgi:micrococcal nuclease